MNELRQWNRYLIELNEMAKQEITPPPPPHKETR